MRGRSLVAVLLAALAFAFAASFSIRVSAEDGQTGAPSSIAPGTPEIVVDPALAQAVATPGASPPLDVAPPQSVEAPGIAQPAPPVDPVVAVIRAKLADPAVHKGAAPDDLAALVAFYGERSGPPVFITVMGFTYRAQTAIDEIGNADDWGLPAASFDLPEAGALPSTQEAQAEAEIKLALAILKYARFARGGRVDPTQISFIIDQTPSLRDPKTVFAEIAATPAPDAYLRSLHPKHEQFERLRQALLKARGSGDEKTKPSGNERDIQRLLVNMERWRWMPEELGSFYVQDNVPDFMLYVVKDGKTIHSDKIVVGELKYATPIFSADMRTIVFNPEWTVPETIVRENLLPNLRGGGGAFSSNTAILTEHELKVRYNGRIVDPGSINWNSVNMASIAFFQGPGPNNVLGHVKFLYPNKHVVYMHDTIKKGLFDPAMRAEGHNCIRMSDPPKLASVLLAEDKGWPVEKINALIKDGNNSAVQLDRPIPVHTTYFTAMVDDQGKLKMFGDVYGLDAKVSAALAKPIAFSASVAEVSTDASTTSGPTQTASTPKPKKEEVAGPILGTFGN
jgi:murein L,D-transpeptidase YcbB/YkuD